MGIKQELAYLLYLALFHTWLDLLRRKNFFHLAFDEPLFAVSHLRVF
jgi:hypothetical protein